MTVLFLKSPASCVIALTARTKQRERRSVGSAIYTWSRAYITRQQTRFEVSTTMANAAYEYNDDEWLEEQLRSPSTSMHDELDDWLEQKLQSPIPAARPTIPPGKQLFS